MKQQDAIKLLAAFMILTMVFSVFAIFLQGPVDTEQTPESKEKYNPELWVISSPFYSISDALKITPVGGVSATYADLESMTPQMVQWVRQSGLPIINEVDSIYKSNTTKMYYTTLLEGENKSFLLLSTMFPEKNDFDYIVLPDTYPPVLRRQDYNGLYNIMGNPAIFAPPQTVVEVLTIISSLNKTNTSYDLYENLLSRVVPAPFQLIDSNVSFAKQFYLGVREVDGNYERTTAYLNLNSSTLKKLNQLKANSTQKGLEYNITQSANYTVVKITGSDLFRVLSEEAS